MNSHAILWRSTAVALFVFLATASSLLASGCLRGRRRRLAQREADRGRPKKKASATTGCHGKYSLISSRRQYTPAAGSDTPPCYNRDQ